MISVCLAGRRRSTVGAVLSSRRHILAVRRGGLRVWWVLLLLLRLLVVMVVMMLLVVAVGTAVIRLLNCAHVSGIVSGARVRAHVPAAAVARVAAEAVRSVRVRRRGRCVRVVAATAAAFAASELLRDEWVEVATGRRRLASSVRPADLRIDGELLLVNTIAQHLRI